ncbi:MAG: twin-arginine translocase TatA/TatE family subunit [Paludibacteraceae bacterium]|nr:twin-arginine translocase TatA/TatE family subunit [Paludibacteraceae bacterium]
MLNMVLLFIGTTEIIVIGGIALLIFGGKKLPELMRGLGKGVKEFKEGMNEVKEEVNNNGQLQEQPQAEEQKKEATPQEPKNE